MRRLTLTLLFMVIALPAAAADVCPALDSGKVNTVGDPQTVTVTAPEGFLIDGYCVKSGPGTLFITVDPPQKTVVVDHPTKDSVSHYSLSYTEVPPSNTTTTFPSSSTTLPPDSSTTSTTPSSTTTTSTPTGSSAPPTTTPPAPTTTVGSPSTSTVQPTLIPSETTISAPTETDPPPVTHTLPPTSTPETLPHTGADPALMLGAALVALVAGGGAVAAGKRR